MEACNDRQRQIGKPTILKKCRIDGKHKDGYLRISIPGHYCWAAFHIEEESEFTLGESMFIVSVPSTNDALQLADAVQSIVQDIAQMCHWTPQTRIGFVLEAHSLDDKGEPAKAYMFGDRKLQERWETFQLAPILSQFIACAEQTMAFVHRVVITHDSPVAKKSPTRRSLRIAKTKS